MSTSPATPLMTELPAMGWIRDLPDFRDYTPERSQVSDDAKALGETKSVKTMLTAVGVEDAPKALPAAVDLRPWCSPIEDQLTIGSCTAQAGVGLVEYFERRAYGKHLDASRLFLYKVSRKLSHWEGDTGAYLRTTMAAMTLFGVPPEEHYPYRIEQFDQEPPAFCYAFANTYRALTFYRLDPPGLRAPDLLLRIRTEIAAGLPAMFGFSTFSSINQSVESGRIPFPLRSDRNTGGHAVVAVGYDDALEIKHASSATATTGALMIRNSWGTGWGEAGYGWLPYSFVLSGLAVDWWSLLRNDWIDTGQFGL